MGKRNYRFTHALGKDEALRRVAPMAENLARKYMMKVTPNATGFDLSGKGTSATVVVTDDAVEVTMDLPFVIEKLAGDQIDRELNYKVPKALA
ncbi:MAG TPA: polyhydroxyalkanoic acid system family protein [Myxococcota bacterium]|nr:polyhydroxyalkanoic acid system family protein [Myxococcota bacterium]HQK50213.1 polyhydroxyalkanoic acid system family protein [Myxococcota bacterium]